MKHFFIISTVTIGMIACAPSYKTLVAEYARQYAYRVLDTAEDRLYFTNQYSVDNGVISFTDHNGAKVVCSACTAVENVDGDSYRNSKRQRKGTE